MSADSSILDGLKETDFETLFRLMRRDNFAIVYTGHNQERDLDLLAESAETERWFSKEEAAELKNAISRIVVGAEAAKILSRTDQAAQDADQLQSWTGIKRATLLSLWAFAAALTSILTVNHFTATPFQGGQLVAAVAIAAFGLGVHSLLKFALGGKRKSTERHNFEGIRNSQESNQVGS